MSSGFDEAKTRRNWLERLGEKIPGFRGFQDRELRRDVDKMQREHLSSELLRLKGIVRDRAQAYTDAGQIGALQQFERLDKRLDGFSQAVRFSDYGATGFFDVVKIEEPELDKLYEFDLSVLDNIAILDVDLSAIPLPGSANPEPAVSAVINRVSVLEDKWAGRSIVISDVVRSANK